MDVKVLYDILQAGGPVGMAAIFCAMWWLERKERMKTQQSILEISSASIQTVAKVEAAISSFQTLINRFMDRYE